MYASASSSPIACTPSLISSSSPYLRKAVRTHKVPAFVFPLSPKALQILMGASWGELFLFSRYDIIKKPPAWPVVFLIILLQDVCSCLPFLKCPLVLTDCGHPVHISMPDRIVKSGNNLFFPAKEVWPGQICCDRMVCDERTVTVSCFF